jgi:hypothetical protein
MKIFNFLKSLLPNFTKDRITEDIRITRAEIQDVTLPAYQTALQGFSGRKWQSEAAKEKMTAFSRMVKGGKNPILYIHDSLPEVLKNLSMIEELVIKNYTDNIAAQGMTYLKANLLQLVEAMGFVSKYARKLLLYLYIAETDTAMPADENGEQSAFHMGSLSKAELDYIDTNFVSFCMALNIVNKNTVELEKLLEEIPDIVVTEDNVLTLPALHGEQKLDPLQMGLIPLALNPIYHVRLSIAEWQANRYKAAVEELRLVQLRHLNLQKLTAGKPDARIEREMLYLESRVKNLNYKIAEMEKQYG